MNRLTQFLLNFVLLKRVGQILRDWVQQVQTRLTNIKPFSWEAMLMLSLFSWFVYLLLRGFYAKKIVSVFAWGFLIIGSDWGLMKQQVKTWLIGFPFQYGPWITAAIASVALLSNDFIVTSWQGALISWPILAAIFAAYPRFIQPGFKFGLPGAEGRQDIVLLFLISGLFSSWFQFHFLIQDLLRTYPNLLNDRFERSIFVTRFNAPPSDPAVPPDSPKARELLIATEANIRQNLTGKDWIATQQWLSRIKTLDPDLGSQVMASVYGDRLSREQRLWQISADVGMNAANNANLDLILTVRWLGASSRPGGYQLRQTCLVSQVTDQPPPQTFEQMQRQTGFLLTCQNPVAE